MSVSLVVTPSPNENHVISRWLLGYVAPISNLMYISTHTSINGECVEIAHVAAYVAMTC